MHQPTEQDKKAAENLRSQGNSLFKQGKWSAAIDRYTEAITLCPEVAVLYVNRAMCHKKRGAWAAVYDDSKHALELDGDLMKAHYLLGLACREQHDLETSTRHLQKALDAARAQNDGIKDDIWRELSRAKYELWELSSAARREERAALRRQLAAMLAQQQQQQTPSEQPPPSSTSNSNGAAPASALPPSWERLFADAAADDVVKEAPSLFTCALTMEVFREPMLSPSGHSYEKSALLEHLKKGSFDPLTRQPITEKQCIPNLGLRAAVQMYLDEHPWAWREAGM